MHLYIQKEVKMKLQVLIFFFFFFFFFLVFLGPYPQHTEVPRLGAELEL